VTLKAVGEGVARLIEHHLAGAGDLQHGRPTEALILDFVTGELSAFGLQVGDGALDVVADK
jgi:hypothetical protein